MMVARLISLSLPSRRTVTLIRRITAYCRLLRWLTLFGDRPGPSGTQVDGRPLS
jgi:hypothetical protein